jgi:hypothetical protein
MASAPPRDKPVPATRPSVAPGPRPELNQRQIPARLQRVRAPGQQSARARPECAPGAEAGRPGPLRGTRRDPSADACTRERPQSRRPAPCEAPATVSACTSRTPALANVSTRKRRAPACLVSRPPGSRPTTRPRLPPLAAIGATRPAEGRSSGPQRLASDSARGRRPALRTTSCRSGPPWPCDHRHARAIRRAHRISSRHRAGAAVGPAFRGPMVPASFRDAAEGRYRVRMPRELTARRSVRRGTSAPAPVRVRRPADPLGSGLQELPHARTLAPAPHGCPAPGLIRPVRSARGPSSRALPDACGRGCR